MSNEEIVTRRVGWEQQSFATELLSGLTSNEMKELEDSFNMKDIHVDDVFFHVISCCYRI